ncbi:MAG: archaetidylserine decarboxylase [Candidatus Thiosymbion ectosymbiont of Robbea hypermnestra]|nr:archaetidylserine decarboxylase [Candidatus Thiosymbion ectosymbiont of Robbea hypermnestra]
MIDRLRWYHRLYVALQYLLPHHLLSALMFRVTRIRRRSVKNLLIQAFVRHYRVDMTEALEPDPRAYASFNAFFTRPLRPGARPLAVQEGSMICPADGILSQLGAIGDGRVFQAKGHDCSLAELLGGRQDWTQTFEGGAFATIYLSPRDYHRVHMPVAATLRETIHIPGRLFSVNPVTTALVPRLFGRNERVLCLFETASGPLALILVGAIFVGSMETRWAGRITPAPGSVPIPGGDRPIRLDRGAEMGRFNMGSTVILLFGPERVVWEPGLEPGAPLRMGQRIGHLGEQPPN